VPDLVSSLDDALRKANLIATSMSLVLDKAAGAALRWRDFSPAWNFEAFRGKCATTRIDMFAAPNLHT